MTINIADTLTEVARNKGDMTGLIEARTGNAFSFAELEARSNRYAAFLAGKGIGEGNRVLLMVKPSADFICVSFALFRLGAPVILIDPGMGYKNLLRSVAQVKPEYLIGVVPAVLLCTLFRRSFRSVKKTICCDSRLGLFGRDLHRQARGRYPEAQNFQPEPSSLAAIIFTTGSTGPPKGVRFEHGVFAAQLRLIKRYYQIGPDDVDQPGFPLFALFAAALGACAVIPDMDATRPAQVDPATFVDSIEKYRVTYSFGSPAIWNVVSRYCLEKGITCRSLKKILMAGAPVSGELIERTYRLMEADGHIFTPYGATESLPIVSIEGREIIEETWKDTRAGKGTCVGRALPGITVRVIEATDQPLASAAARTRLPTGVIGEIIVKGDVVTRAYDHNEAENRFSKIVDKDELWHRLGDVGYMDAKGRLWFCGRKAHRVNSAQGIMYTIPCEAIINNHPEVFRSALVGIDGSDGYQVPVIIIELEKDAGHAPKEILEEVRGLARAHALTDTINHFLIHPSFPVDIRHNAKIFREKLKIWAHKQLELCR